MILKTHTQHSRETLIAVYRIADEQGIDTNVLKYLGPQWLEICQLTQRMALLTEAEHRALGDEYQNGNWYDAWQSCWIKMTPDRRDAFDAVRASWVKTMPHYPARASSVMAGLMMRDRIDGRTKWNRKAYETLVAGWVRIVGPLHPEDLP